LLGQGGPCFPERRETRSSVPRARLPGALREAVRWWSRRGGAFPLLSITLAFRGGLLELAQSGRAAGEPLAPSKPPVPRASPAGSPSQGGCPLSRWDGLRAALGCAAAEVAEGQTELGALSLPLGKQSLQQFVLTPHPCRHVGSGTHRAQGGTAQLGVCRLKGSDPEGTRCRSSAVGTAERGRKQSADGLAGSCVGLARGHTQTC